MKINRKWLLYFLFVLTLTASFIYYLFPSDQVKNFINFNLNNTYPDIRLTIDHIKPAFPPGVRLDNVNLYQMDNFLLNADQIKIIPDFLSLFGSKILFFFKASTCTGILEGKGEVPRSMPVDKVKVDARFSDIQISKMPAVHRFSNRKISGVLDGNFTYSIEKNSGEDLRAKLILSDCEIELLSPFLALEFVTFNTIEADLAITNQKLQFKRCSLKGSQMDGSIGGSVMLKKPMGKSVLNLAGTVRPHRLFLTQLEKDFPKNMLPKIIFNKNGFPIKFHGTLDQPSFSLN